MHGLRAMAGWLLPMPERERQAGGEGENLWMNRGRDVVLWYGHCLRPQGRHGSGGIDAKAAPQSLRRGRRWGGKKACICCVGGLCKRVAGGFRGVQRLVARDVPPTECLQ